MKRFLTLIMLSACSPGEGTRLSYLDHEFSLAPGSKDGRDFIVYGDERCWIELDVEVKSGSVDVVVLEDGKPLPEFSKTGISGSFRPRGYLPGDVYRVEVSSAGASSVHVKVVRDFDR